MALRKIDLMYKHFGKAAEGKCKECQHFCKGRYHDKNLQKCEVYGLTHSEATDWKQSYDACGLFPDKPYDGTDIVRMVRPERQRKSEDIPGQQSLF